jgi:hypothetical protein
MILLLIRGGLDVSSVPIFSDRGNLLAASRVLLRCHGTILTLKFCLEHLILNVIGRGHSDSKDQWLLAASHRSRGRADLTGVVVVVAC